MTDKFPLHLLTLPDSAAGLRLDQALAASLSQYSRSRLAAWIKSTAITVDGKQATPSQRVQGGEAVSVRADIEPDDRVLPQSMPLDILHEDPWLLVINKPAGLVVHPGAGMPHSTLQNALLAHDPALASVPRSGLVHRLDKDTSGLLVVARTLDSHRLLSAALQAHTIEREYLAICRGVPAAGGRIELPIGRHRRHRTRMSVRTDGRAAVTHFVVRERFRGHALLAVRLETGRTHQIRVHLAHQGFAVAGDPVYGARRVAVAGAGSALAAALQNFHRQALHARRLSLLHPGSGRRRVFEAPPPADFQQLLRLLRADARRRPS